MTRVKCAESDTIEFKECRGRLRAKLPADIWQTIAAFSNSHGGKIFLGVADSGEVACLSNQDLDNLQKDVSNLANTAFNNKPRLKICVEHGYVVAEVLEAEFYNKPIFSKKVGPKKIFIRQGAANALASDEELKSLFAGATGGGENQILDGNYASLVDEEKINDYIGRTGLAGATFTDLHHKLLKIKALRDNHLTMFGLIAFAKDELIDDLSNNLYIDFKVFPGTKKVSPLDLGVIYLDRREFHGNIKTQFLGAFEYIKSKLPKESVLNVETGLREERFILPEDALREALSNCLAHRDYMVQSSCVNVDLFSDRIELSNPGESLVALDNLECAPSKARNPNLMEYLKVYHITDKTARGIPTIYQAARSRGLLEPRFENISGCFRATLYFSAPHSREDREWVENLTSAYKIKDTQKNALIFIKNTGDISNKQYCEINHMEQRNDDRRARRELAELVDKELIRPIGVGPGTRYILNNR